MGKPIEYQNHHQLYIPISHFHRIPLIGKDHQTHLLYNLRQYIPFRLGPHLLDIQYPNRRYRYHPMLHLYPFHLRISAYKTQYQQYLLLKS